MKRKYQLTKDVLGSSKDFPLEHNPAIVFCSEEYSMLGADLTNIPTLEKCFDDIGIDYTSPTLFISECSITYIDPKSSDLFISWVQQCFPNSVFVSYEQVYPDDGFGIIMRNHFTQVGCTLKSITVYPDEESQCKRYKELGWSDSKVITMYDLFNSLPLEEKRRIQLLEMFDEYEMWNEKCHHYILVWASQGVFSQCLPPFLEVKNSVKTTPMKRNVNWKFMAAHEVAQRFGHQVIPLSSSVILVSGGFGMMNKRHQRLGDISIYNIASEECLQIPLGDKKQKMGNRMFHTMTKLSNETIVILGGRSSPNKIFKEILIFHPNCHSSIMELDKISPAISFSQHTSENCLSSMATNELTMPEPTWRHSASLVDIKGTEFVVIFGGCSQDHVATNELHMLNTETWKWSKVNVQGHIPCPRHSHSAATFNKSFVIVTGGLTEDETILESVHMFDAASSEWSDLLVSGLLPRYSHSSHIWNNYLFLIGGITSCANFKLFIGVVDLNTLQAFEVKAPAQDPEFPILFSNHSSYVQDDEIFIVGGGGNCFSFGTHFNKKILSISLKLLTES